MFYAYRINSLKIILYFLVTYSPWPRESQREFVCMSMLLYIIKYVSYIHVCCFIWVDIFGFFRQRFSLSDSCLNLHTCKEHKYPSDRLVIVQRIQNHFGALNKCTFQSPSIRTCDMRMYRWMHFEHKVHMWLSSCGQRVNQSCPVLFCPDQLSPVPSTVASQSFMPSWNIYIHICIHACPMDLWCQCIALCRCLCFVIREWMSCILSRFHEIFVVSTRLHVQPIAIEDTGCRKSSARVVAFEQGA